MRIRDIYSLQFTGLFDDRMLFIFPFSLSLCQVNVCVEKEVFHYSNHPIKFVRVVGVVVAIDNYIWRKIYTVDDGSGMCIECTAVPPPAAPLAPKATLGNVNQPSTSISTSTKPNVTILESAKEPKVPTTENPLVPWDLVTEGTIVKITGRVAAYMDTFQIQIVKVSIMRSTDEEVKWWEEARLFKVDVLGRAWVVGKREEERCRRRAERGVKKEGRREYGGIEKNKKEAKREEMERVRLATKREEKRRVEPTNLPLKDRQRHSRLPSHDPTLPQKREKHKHPHSEEDSEKKARRRKERGEEREVLDGKDKRNVPSLSIRRMVLANSAKKGKYDLLGI